MLPRWRALPFSGHFAAAPLLELVATQFVHLRCTLIGCIRILHVFCDPLQYPRDDRPVVRIRFPPKPGGWLPGPCLDLSLPMLRNFIILKEVSTPLFP